MEKYPEVNKAHIVPASYLRNFADGSRLGVYAIESGRHLVKSPKSVGWRKQFYSRTRPDGSRIDDVEWSMGNIESEVTPLVREMEARWPLSNRDKATLGEFAALQMVRTPRFRQWDHDKIARFAEEAATDQAREQLSAELGGPVTEHTVRSVVDGMRSSTETLTRMLGLLDKTGSILASMHWTLVCFDKPLIATSDQPVHVWPMERSRSKPQVGRIDAGLLTALEVRLPLTPRLALLMTWLPAEDPPEPVKGLRHHPKNINAFTVVEADRHWFYYPETRPPVGDATYLPISGDLHRGYDAQAAWRSPLRAEVSRLTQPKLGTELQKDSKIEMVRWSGETPSRRG